jgi:signal transduction histidine kinase
LTNLLGNANKFTEHGEIKVEMKIRDSEQLVITVEDTGIGMTAEQLDRIFEVFEQADHSTSAKYGGTGLGLSLCREFATLLGGTITAASTPEKGSLFTVTLPVHRA